MTKYIYYKLLALYFFFYIIFIYKNKPYLIVVFGDTYYIDIIRNLYHNVILKYNIHEFVVATVSITAYDVYKDYAIPVKLIEYNTTGYVEYTNIDSQHFVKKMHIRTYILYYFIKNKQPLIHIDADTYYLSNPLTIYKMKQKTDIAFACNNPNCSRYNTGYMYKY